MSDKVAKILLYGLLVTFPLGMLVRFKVANNIYITPQDIIVFFLFILSIVSFIRMRRNFMTDKFMLFQGLFLFTGLISLIVNAFLYKDINFLVSILYLLRYVIYLSLFNISNLFEKKGFERKILVFSGSTFLMLGFLQFFLYYDLKYLYYLGWDNHLYRLFSTFLDPNYAGVFYSLYFIFTFSDVLYKKIKQSYKELVLSFFIVIAVYLTYSRTALISFLVGIATIAILKRKLKIFLFSILAFVVLLSTLSDVSIEGLNPFRTASSVERIISVKEALTIFSDNPAIGVGFNAYRYSLIRNGFRTGVGVAMSNADAGTDNSFLFVLATTGVIGFTFFALSYLFLLKKLYAERLIVGIIPFCLTISFLASSLFLNVLFYMPILIFVFIVISLRRQVFGKLE